MNHTNTSPQGKSLIHVLYYTGETEMSMCVLVFKEEITTLPYQVFFMRPKVPRVYNQDLGFTNDGLDKLHNCIPVRYVEISPSLPGTAGLPVILCPLPLLPWREREREREGEWSGLFLLLLSVQFS